MEDEIFLTLTRVEAGKIIVGNPRDEALILSL